MSKIPDFGKQRVRINSGGYETVLECAYVAPLTTFSDLMEVFDRAEAEAEPGDHLSGNPAKWPNHRGVYAVVEAVLKAVYEFEPPAAGQSSSHRVSDGGLSGALPANTESVIPE